MRLTSAILFLAICAGMISSTVAQQKPAGRYDGQILQDVNKYLQSKKEFQGVKAYGVVDSAMDKQIAGTQTNSVPGVFSVDNQLIALSDIKK